MTMAPELLAQLHELIDEHTSAAERERAVIRTLGAALEAADRETAAQLEEVMDGHERRRGALAGRIAEMARRVGKLPVLSGQPANTPVEQEYGHGVLTASDVQHGCSHVGALAEGPAQPEQPVSGANNPHGIVYKLDSRRA